jgi:hypothetical protein
MPRIFDNIDTELLPALQETLSVSERADFCVGYFNLRGWKVIDGLIDQWPGGEGKQCRLLVPLTSAEERDAKAFAGTITSRDTAFPTAPILQPLRSLKASAASHLLFKASVVSNSGIARQIFGLGFHFVPSCEASVVSNSANF